MTRLEAFLNGDVNRAGFTIEADMIKETLKNQVGCIRYVFSKKSKIQFFLIECPICEITAFINYPSLSLFDVVRQKQ